MDAADLFFEKFGPGAFCQEAMEAEKKKHLGQDANHLVLDYVGQFPDSPKRIVVTSETLGAPSLTQPSMPVLLKGIKARGGVRRLALRPRAQRHWQEARV